MPRIFQNLAALGNLQCDKRTPDNPDRPKKNNTRKLFLQMLSFWRTARNQNHQAKGQSIRNRHATHWQIKQFSFIFYFLEPFQHLHKPPCTKQRAWLHEVPGLTESIFLKTLSVAQPLLGSLANTGAARKAPHKALFAPLSNTTAAFLPHHRVMRDRVAAWPLPGADHVCCKGPLGFEKEIFRDIETGTHIDEFSHTFRGAPRHFRANLSRPDRDLWRSGRKSGPPVPDPAQSRRTSGGRLQWQLPVRSCSVWGFSFPDCLLVAAGEGPGRPAPPCDFGLRSWISPASTTSAVSMPEQAEGRQCLAERLGPGFSGKRKRKGGENHSLFLGGGGVRRFPSPRDVKEFAQQHELRL